MATLRASNLTSESRRFLTTTPGWRYERIAHAYAGNKAEAIRDGERAVQLLPMSKDGVSGPENLHLLARVYTVVGEPDKAVDALRQILGHPYFITREWLRIDPDFSPLKNNPGFKHLIAGS